MFCLRSWLPLLFIPTNASPLFVVTFFLLTYFLNRPCVYCSILLLVLFISSCYWSDHCFFDIHSNWFEPRHISSPMSNPLSQAQGGPNNWNATEQGVSSFLMDTVNETANALGSAAVDAIKRRTTVPNRSDEWTGVGVEWLRSWLGAREWKVPCLNVHIRL
ncbi:MAG: hypothetical protein Q9176_001513 [Flavoplaca citrina]